MSKRTARITLTGSSSHESSHGKFAKRGSYIDTTDTDEIEYFTAQSEFSITYPNIAAKRDAGTSKQVERPTRPAPEKVERRPWSEKMAKPELYAECQRRGLGVVPEDTKGIMIEQLKADDRVAAGKDPDSED